MDFNQMMEIAWRRATQEEKEMMMVSLVVHRTKDDPVAMHDFVCAESGVIVPSTKENIMKSLQQLVDQHDTEEEEE